MEKLSTQNIVMIIQHSCDIRADVGDMDIFANQDGAEVAIHYNAYGDAYSIFDKYYRAYDKDGIIYKLNECYVDSVWSKRLH